MHIFFLAVQFFIKLLMRITMFFTKEKTNYLMVPETVLSYINIERICNLCHVLPSLIFSVIIGVKILPDMWPYYAAELEKNGIIIPFAIFLAFIPVAIINGIIIEKILVKLNPKYLSFKNSLKESGN